MTWKIYSIDRYTVTLADPKREAFSAMIACDAADFKVLIYFVPDDPAIQPHDAVHFGDNVRVWHRDTYYPRYIDLLRNETPIFALVNDGVGYPGGPAVTLKTSDEPIGEEETQSER